MTHIGEPPAAVAGGTPVARLPAGMPAETARSADGLDLDVDPSIAAGRRARYVAVVTNRSGHEIDARLSVTPSDDRLRVLIVPTRMTLGAGQAYRAEVLLRPRRPQLLRRERQHDAQIRIRGPEGPVVVARRIIFVQQRAISPWVFALLVPLIAAAAFGVTKLPHRVAVPAVEGAPDVATAERAIDAAGLRLDPRLRSRTTENVKPGTILDQIPDPGVHVDRGASVTLLVSVGARRVATPALTGRTSAEAAILLRGAGLVTGPVLPSGAHQPSVVASQLPIAGARVPVGTAVTIFVRAAGTGAAGPTVATPAGGKATVPAIAGRSVAVYAHAVVAAGLAPHVIRTVDSAPIGTLLGVKPRPGLTTAAGDRVRLLVSAGVPQVAFDTGEVLRVFDPRLNRTVREASPPQGTAVEPSWSSDGRRLLYRVGRRLLLVSAHLGTRGETVYDGSTKYASATFAPSPADGVIALVRRTGDDGDLCFARLGDTMLRPRCTADPRWDLGRQISWRHGGHQLLVFGVRRGHPGRFGILRYSSVRPFSTNPADWHGALATDTSVSGHGVIAAAYSPSGADVAMVTNFGLPRFQLLVTASDDLNDPVVKALPVRACEAAWRPDGNEIAVVQSDDECARPVGEIARVDPQHPRETITISSGGRHPAYQPLTYAGPKGIS